MAKGGKKTIVTYKPENRNKFFGKASNFPDPVLDTSSTTPFLLASFGKGELPRNAEISNAIEKTKMTLEEQKSNTMLNGKGQDLLEDAREILTCLEKFILEKNRGEQLQFLFNQSKEAAREVQKTHGDRIKNAASGIQLGNEVKNAMNQVKELLVIFVSSSEFRMLIAEGLELARTFMLQYSQTDNTTGITVKFQEDDPTIVSMSNLLQKLSAKSEYRKAVRNFFELFDHLQSKASEIKVGEISVQAERLTQMKTYAQSLLEEFTGKNTLDDYFKTLQGLYNEMKNDANAKMFLTQLRSFVIETIKAPGELNNPVKKEELKHIIGNAKIVVTSPRYKTQIDNILEMSKVILNRIKDDTTFKDLSARLSSFGRHLMLDNYGRPDPLVLSDSLKQLKNVIIPILSKNIESIAIPRITGSNAFYDMAIENVLVNGSGLIPDLIDFKFKTEVEMNINKLSTDTSSTKLTFIVKGMRTNLKNIEYWINKKTFPKVEDKGKIDIDLMDGEGINVEISWTLKSEGSKPLTVELRKVKCTLDKLHVKVHDAKHNFVDKVGVSLFAKRIKKEFATSIVKAIVTQLEPINGKINQYFMSRPLDQITNKFVNTLKPKAPVYHYSEESPKKNVDVENTQKIENGKMEIVPEIQSQPPQQQVLTEQSSIPSIIVETPVIAAENDTNVTMMTKNSEIDPNPVVIPMPPLTDSTLTTPTTTTTPILTETVIVPDTIVSADSDMKPFSWFSTTEGSKVVKTETETFSSNDKLNNDVSATSINNVPSITSI